MTSESEGRDHWLELVENLGVEPVAEDSQPKPSPQAPTPEAPTPQAPVARSPREMPRKPAAPRPSSGWSELAGQFGIELPPEEPEVERPARVVRPIPAVERNVAKTPAAMPPAVVSHAVTPHAETPTAETPTAERTPADRPSSERRPFERPPVARTPDVAAERAWQPAAQEISDRTTSLPAEDRGPVEEPIAESRDARPAWNEPEARLEDLPGYIDPPAMLDDSDTLEEMLSFRDERQAEMEGDDYASEPAVRRRRRRRGHRRDEESSEATESRPDKAEAREPRSPESRVPESRVPESRVPAPVEDLEDEAEQDDESHEDSAASSEESTRESVVRRRRRRRRRRGGEEREADEARVSGSEAEPVESSAGKPRATESDDDTDDTDLDDDFADVTSADDQSDETSAAKHRKIPTWEDAVTIVIDANLQSRSRSGGNSRGGDARGGGGGGGRRRGRR